MAKAKFDRNSLRGTSLDVIQEQNKEIASSSKKRDYLQIKEGTNKIRFFPAHPDSDPKNRYAQQKFVAWLPYKNNEDKVVNRSYLNARAHGGQEKDLIEEFVKVAVELIQSSSLSTKEKGVKLNALSDYKTGVKHQGKYLAYAEDISSGDRGLIEISYGVKKKLDAISTAEVEEEPDGADVISDPNEGYAITIKYDKSKPNNDKYSVQLGRKISPVSDESLDWWFDEDSLVEILHNNVNYHKGIIDSIKSGLEIYDETHDLGVVDSEEFEAIFNELRKALPDAPERDDNGSSSDSDSGDDDAEEVVLGEMTKAELKQFVMDAGLEIKVGRKDTEDDILDKIEDETGLTDENYPSDLSEVETDKGDDVESDDDDEVFEDEKDEEEVPEVEEKKTSRTRNRNVEEPEDVEAPTRRTRRSRRERK